jgi:hypothetical protein
MSGALRPILDTLPTSVSLLSPLCCSASAHRMVRFGAALTILPLCIAVPGSGLSTSVADLLMRDVEWAVSMHLQRAMPKAFGGGWGHDLPWLRRHHSPQDLGQLVELLSEPPHTRLPRQLSHSARAHQVQ